jgi:hypothetical protein
MAGPISEADREFALGNQTPLPVADRAPDPLVDSLESDGTQASERRAGESVPHAPGGGR